ncbi:RHOF [Branchiostoma lanceolatum]|uniref:RHOF protein n=1 Tax=Branchiostoma lanceolatum TaxID=7740 RepID=A0A8J9V9F4_BRALA|nr:RHOF [Branchiostoma lanceolatum]
MTLVFSRVTGDQGVTTDDVTANIPPVISGILTSGLRRQEDYDRLRPLSYNDADVIIICFDVSSQASFENVEVRWAPEIRHFCRGIPIFLIACKSDLRNDRNMLQQLAYKGQEPVSYEQGMALAKRIRARGYMECSARYGENLDHVFMTAAKTAANVQTRRHRKINCTLL